MLKTRLWRVCTATVAVGALLMTTVGGATAQTEPVGELLDEQQLEQLGELLDDEDEGLTGTPLDEILDQLGLDSLDELLVLLETAEEGDTDPQFEEGEAGGGEIPDAGIGGFVGQADATGLEVAIGLPEQLREGAAPLIEGLGIGGPDGIHIKISETEADLRRAAAGEDVEGLAKALATNLLLDSEGSPGACQGVPETIELPPDQDVPLLRVAIANVDCEQDDERAFAKAEVAGLTVSLAGLIEAGFPEDIRDGIDQVLDPLNEELLAQLNDGCDESVGTIIGELLPDSDSCDALELQIRNPFDVDVPLVDVNGLNAESEVTATDADVTADAAATLASVNLAGLICVGTDGGDPLSHTAGVSTDGESGNANATAVDVTRLCENDTSILRLIDGSSVVDSTQLFGTDITNLFDGELEQVFEGLDALFEAMGATVVTGGAPYETTDGAGAVAGVTPMTVVGLAPFGEIPGLNEFLGDLEVRVTAMEVEAAVNAAPEAPGPAPAGPDAEPVPEGDLPKTGASAALLGLGAMGAAIALRRREDDEDDE